jgi:hypothetical protein
VSCAPIVRDRERRTSEAFRMVREAAAGLARRRSAAPATEDARAVAAVAGVLGALVGLLDAYDVHRAAGTPVDMEKTSGASPVGLFLRLK